MKGARADTRHAVVGNDVDEGREPTALLGTQIADLSSGGHEPRPRRDVSVAIDARARLYLGAP
ncbi:hypothetical protein D7207_16105 [Burkholderia cepacia]|nr:hypothetical protein [Burkholderia cepacia]MBA9945963.1 hypothetical protein [Burkholderia cepacia]MBA9977141.1 hypothetical protein [Burkholderia cepacia]MBA9994487.1 hypothetical protein [Burkholderia cepacia]MBB0003428.1 hypothetical protein [Burkholderia cepacia]